MKICLSHKKYPNTFELWLMKCREDGIVVNPIRTDFETTLFEFWYEYGYDGSIISPKGYCVWQEDKQLYHGLSYEEAYDTWEKATENK